METQETMEEETKYDEKALAEIYESKNRAEQIGEIFLILGKLPSSEVQKVLDYANEVMKNTKALL